MTTLQIKSRNLLRLMQASAAAVALRPRRTPRAAALALTGAALFGGLLSPAWSLVLGVTEGVTYRATDNQIETRFAPIADLMSKATKQPVTIKVMSSYNDLREALKDQRVDVAFIHPAHVAYEAIKPGNYKAVAWTAGFTEYKVTLLCKEPATISNWNTVTGKNLVTPDPDSITSVMTRALLREHGVGENTANAQTTRYQDAVPFYVQHGFAVYGATAARGVIKAWKESGGKTCAESRAVPIKQWLVSSKLDPFTSTQLRETLLGLNATEAGKKALAASTYAGFVAPTPDVEQQLVTWLGL